jgi:N-acyl-D-amino-acid deacylase
MPRLSRVVRASLALALPAALAACRAAGTAASPVPADAPYDLVIENGRVVDGTGNPWFYGDVAVRGDRIAAVAPRGTLRRARAARRVDATGLVVAPGFIDIQGQSGNSLLFGDGRLVSKVTQGVTTEILGEGSTPAPTTAAMQGDLAARMPALRATLESLRGPRGFDAWLGAMERRGVSVNVGAFVGAGTLREYGMGLAMGDAGAAALDSMRTALARAMEDGALGLGSALIYPPGNFAGTAELVALSRAMAPYGGVYITHLRSEADDILAAMDEAIRIGREAGVAVEIFHLKPAGQANWAKWPAVAAKIDSARRAGLDVQATMYPYTAGATGLTSCLPPWTSADGRLFDNLADSAVRARIRAEVARPAAEKEWEDLCAQATPAGVLVSDLRTPALRPYAGKRLSEIAAAMGRTPLDAAMDLILGERRRVETTYFLMSEENVRRNLQQPWMKIGTDAGGLDPDSTRTLTHPRAFGTYPRILGRYVRDEGALTLEEAVRKMTSAVATRLSLADRGSLSPGSLADMVLFDPATIADRATYEQPLQLSVGVRHVWVNGVQVLQDGRHTGARPGRAVRGPGWRGLP